MTKCYKCSCMLLCEREHWQNYIRMGLKVTRLCRWKLESDFVCFS